MTDLDLGGKIVQETGVSFNIIILEMVTIKGQSQKKYDQFLTQYASWLAWPICILYQYVYHVIDFLHPQTQMKKNQEIYLCREQVGMFRELMHIIVTS